MTLGQRIAQKRKEQSLSQEALGEALGVSRQSVYKWESDSALPEIDKLVTMSRMFHVTIGWLLGVEEAGEIEISPDSPKTDPGELNDTQLKMVEEIVDRYLTAQQPVKKRRWPWFAAAALAATVLLVVLNSLRTDLQNMQNQYMNLQNSVNNITWSVDSQINGITNRVEEILKSQNSLIADYGTSILSTNFSINTITFSAYAAPKTYTKGMTAKFLIDNGSSVTEFNGKLEENHTFTADLTCMLTEGITISVVFTTGDVSETQILDTYSCLYSRSLPDMTYMIGPNNGLMWKKLNADGALDWSGEHEAFRPQNASSVSYMDDAQIEQAGIKSLRIGLFQNQKLLGWLEPCEKPDSYHNFDEDEHAFYRYPDVSVVPEQDDVFLLAAVVLDEYNREFVYAGFPYSLERDGSALEIADANYVGPGIGLYTPADWEY